MEDYYEGPMCPDCGTELEFEFYCVDCDKSWTQKKLDEQLEKEIAKRIEWEQQIHPEWFIKEDQHMNKQELKNQLNQLIKELAEEPKTDYNRGKIMAFETALIGVDKLDITPVEVPEFVAEFIKSTTSMTLGEIFKRSCFYDNCDDQFDNWMNIGNNDEVFARAWLDGYTVEKEPEYVVIIDDLYLKESLNDNLRYVEMTWDLEYAYKFKSLNKAEEHASKLGGEIVPVKEEK